MRYTLDSSGYVFAVAFGSYLDNCKEYTGEVPAGYSTLEEWATTAYIHAYYILDDNLTLDSERLEECQNRQAQEAIDYAPLVRKDLYESDEVLDSQYIRQVATGKVIVLENIKTIAPRVRITNINPYEYDTLTLHTQCKNMMPCTGRGQTISGVSFTRNFNGSVGVIGKATADIEYIISECNFTLKANENYYLNLGGLNCELRFNDNGEIAQQYIGASGLINLPKNTEVSQVIIKISNGQSVNTTFYPQLEYGKSFSSYVEYKYKTLDIEFGSLIRSVLFPGNDLYPSDTLYPTLATTIDYILIENGGVTVSVNGGITLLTSGAVGLFGSNSTIYANKDVTLEVEYSSSLIDVDSLEFLQGKSTTTNQFKILKDGSIEAHNGYFSGCIEADSGYFKGEINVNNRFIVDQQGNVTLPSNAVLSWGQITDQPTIPTNTNQLTNGAGFTTMTAVEAKGYQDASQVTQITKNTVTTSYVNALKVKAGSVDAENITGTTITGKVLKGVTGEFSGKITSTSGEIGGFTIGTTSIYSGYKSSIASSNEGVYIGTDGISVGKANLGPAFKVTASGDISFSGNGSIEFGSAGSASGLTYIDKSKVQVDDTYINNEGFYTKDSVGRYVKIEPDNMRMYYDYNTYFDLNYSGLELGSDTPFYIKNTNGNLLSFDSSILYASAPTVGIGGTSSYLGFFYMKGGTGTPCSKKQTVSAITTPSSATASTVATKLNELLTALKAYNLIG